MSAARKVKALPWYNKLLSRAQRAGLWGTAEGASRLIDEARSSGRSTRIALQTLAKAIDNPGVWIECVDHPSAASNMMGSDNVANIVMSIAQAMQLKFVEKRRLVGANYTSIRSNHMTQNPWEVI